LNTRYDDEQHILVLQEEDFFNEIEQRNFVAENDPSFGLDEKINFQLPIVNTKERRIGP
jgi:hypothetical protein